MSFFLILIVYHLMKVLCHAQFGTLITNETILISTQSSHDFHSKGHFDTAHCFDASWLEFYNETHLDDYLITKLYLPLYKHVILYDYEMTRLLQVKEYVARKFNSSSLQTIKVVKLNDSLVGNLTRELNYNIIISPKYLNELLMLNESENNNVYAKPFVFDVSYGTADKYYAKGHIPTAVHINTDAVEEGPVWNRRSIEELATLIGNLGIKVNNSEIIVFYGNPDPMAAYRVALIFSWMGVKNIRILNGGFNEWLRKNFSIETNTTVKRDGVLYEEFVIDDDLIVDYDFVSDVVNNYALFWELYQLIDIRSWDEFRGNKSGYDDLEFKGRIPYSTWGKAGSNPNQLEDYRNLDLTMRSSEEIREMWNELGVDYLNRHLIFYCGSGWRAAEVFFYAQVMGLEKVSVYDGGWYEWSMMANNSFEIGEPFELIKETTTATTKPHTWLTHSNCGFKIALNLNLFLGILIKLLN